MSSMGGSVGYALLCVLVPVVWGLAVVWIVAKVEKRIGEAATDEPERPVAMDDKA